MKKLFIILFLAFAVHANAQDPAYPPAPAAPLNLVKAEYFIDTDPGFGLATDIPLTAAQDIPSLAASINTLSLTAGVHRLYVRTLNAEGEWSLSTVMPFVVDFDPAYSAAPAAPLNVVKAEYFIDTDPGFGLGTDIPLTAAVNIASLAASINTGSLIIGSHRLYVRTLNAEGEWSLTAVSQFVVDFDPAYPTAPPAPQFVTKMEYFIDTDPGFGAGTDIPVTATTDINGFVAGINTNLLTAGSHQLYIRTRNNEGRWSITGTRSFIVDENPVYPASPASPGNISFLEYFFDTDPGFGNGTPVPITPGVDISNLSFTVNTGSLTQGTHHLYIRSFDDWGLTSVREFLVSSTLPVTFAGFNGRLQGNNVLLDWTTSTEINSSHFEIERSTDGNRFITIGRKTAAGNSSTRQDYSFTDPSLPEGIYFYRLKQVDNDGRFKYSAVIRLRVRTGAELVLMPNPARQHLQISGLANNSNYIIVNAAGKQERNGIWNGQSISLEGLAAGMYFLQVQQGDQWIRKPFIKQ